MAMGRQRKLKNGLTPKQNKFAEIVIEQIGTTGEINATEAAAEVYDAKDRKVAGTIGSENMEKPIIKMAIEEALNANGGNTTQIAQNITNLANFRPIRVSAETVLKANIEILKLTGEYPDKKTVKKRWSVKQKVETLDTGEAHDQLQKVHSEVTEFFQETQTTI